MGNLKGPWSEGMHPVPLPDTALKHAFMRGNTPDPIHAIHFVEEFLGKRLKANRG